MVDELKAYQDSIAEVGRVVAESSKSISDAVAKMVDCREKIHKAVDAAAVTVTANITSDMAAIRKPA